jgi:hypothetical protein
MATAELEERVRRAARAGSVEVNTGECKHCYWKTEMCRRVKENPGYIPYGGLELRGKCLSTKNYKNCAGFMSLGD